MSSTFKAHIFKQRQVGEREEVRLKIFGPDGEPLDLGSEASSDPLVLLDEKFDTDLSAYVANSTQGVATSLNGLVVADGMMHTTDANDHTFHAPAVSYVDGTQIFKIWPNGYSLIGVMKRISDQRWLLLQYMPGSNTFGMYYSTEDGINQVLANNFGSPPTNGPVYLVMTTDGQNVHGASYLVDPRSGARPYSAADARIPNDVASRLVAPGNPGVRFTGYSGGYFNPGVSQKLDEWICKLNRPLTSS
jgi:hypothetical protein